MTEILGTSDTAWVKSSYSNGNEGECVEFAPGHALVTGMVPVRDSKDPAGPGLAFSAAAWSAFTAAVRRGEFPGV